MVSGTAIYFDGMPVRDRQLRCICWDCNAVFVLTTERHGFGVAKLEVDSEWEEASCHCPHCGALHDLL